MDIGFYRCCATAKACICNLNTPLLLLPPPTANCSATKRRVDPLCSHAGRDQREQGWCGGAGRSAPGCMSSLTPDTALEGPVVLFLNVSSCLRERKDVMENMTGEKSSFFLFFFLSFFLFFIYIRSKYKHPQISTRIFRALRSRLAGLSPVFLEQTQASGLFTSDTNIKPYSRKRSSFLQPDALKVLF